MAYQFRDGGETMGEAAEWLEATLLILDGTSRRGPLYMEVQTLHRPSEGELQQALVAIQAHDERAESIAYRPGEGTHFVVISSRAAARGQVIPLRR